MKAAMARSLSTLKILLISLLMLIPFCCGNPDAKRLYDNLLVKQNYQKLARPVRNSSDAVHISFGLKFAQLIDVDTKNEIMTTNMWVMQEWIDYNLRWNPEEYGGLDVFYVPADQIWLPDVVLYNSADGHYALTLTTKAMVTHDGRVQWSPPAILNSICDIDVEYFPFDEQICKLKFIPWSHDGLKVDMRHILHATSTNKSSYTDVIEVGIDMQDFLPSQEWDVLAVPAQKSIVYYPCCEEPYNHMTFNITLRRKTLFYSFNIIVPCVCINLLTLTCFYVPCDCSEKISICITILLSLSMFQLLLLDLVPGTSLTVPLLGKYILFTLFVLTGSVICSVISLNVHYRGNKVGLMGRFTKWFFLEVLAKLMCIRLPSPEEHDQYMQENWSPPPRHSAGIHRPSLFNLCQRKSAMRAAMKRYTAQQMDECYPGFSISPAFVEASERCDECEAFRNLPNVNAGLNGVAFIAKHHTDAYFAKKMKNDWICMALVVDRFLLWLYITLTLICTMVLLLNAPSLFDPREGLKSTWND